MYVSRLLLFQRECFISLKRCVRTLQTLDQFYIFYFFSEIVAFTGSTTCSWYYLWIIRNIVSHARRFYLLQLLYYKTVNFCEHFIFMITQTLRSWNRVETREILPVVLRATNKQMIPPLRPGCYHVTFFSRACFSWGCRQYQALFIEEYPLAYMSKRRTLV